jgi:hypothetical protein
LLNLRQQPFHPPWAKARSDPWGAFHLKISLDGGWQQEATKRALAHSSTWTVVAFVMVAFAHHGWPPEPAAQRKTCIPKPTPPFHLSPESLSFMGLDKNDSTPPVDFTKRTTKVNISVIVAVLVFFVIAGVVVFALSRSPEKSQTEAVPLPG